jgi:hypothetical protein
VPGVTSRDRPDRVPVNGDEQVQGNRRIYLHIGEPKTGTSYVQDALWGNRRQLASQGIALPGYSHGGHARASQDLRRVPRLDSDPADPWAGEWEVLAGQAQRARGAAVISNELLAACNARQANRAVRSLLPAEVHIIVTVRDFATLLPAEWQESIKCRGTVPWEQWLASVVDSAPDPERRRRSWFWKVHDTLAIIGLWSRHIPPDQIHVIPLPRQGITDELWLRFAAVLGIESRSLQLPKCPVNSSLGLAEAEFLRRLNQALPDEMPGWFYTWNVKRILAQEVLGARAPQARLLLPPGDQAWAREQSELLIAGLRDSAYHIVGDLGELLPQPTTGRYVPPSSVPAAQLLETAVHATAALTDCQYRGDIVTSSSDLTVGMQPAQRQPGKPGGRRRMTSRLAWTILRRSHIKRVLYRASHHSAVRQLRILTWRVVSRPERRHP